MRVQHARVHAVRDTQRASSRLGAVFFDRIPKKNSASCALCTVHARALSQRTHMARRMLVSHGADLQDSALVAGVFVRASRRDACARRRVRERVALRRALWMTVRARRTRCVATDSALHPRREITDA